MTSHLPGKLWGNAAAERPWRVQPPPFKHRCRDASVAPLVNNTVTSPTETFQSDPTQPHMLRCVIVFKELKYC